MGRRKINSQRPYVRDSKPAAKPVAVRDSLQTFTGLMPTAWVSSPGGIFDINHWRRFYMRNILARVAVDRIPEDCFRKGYTWGGADAAQMNLLLATERRLNLRETLQRATMFSRLDGEAYIYMDDGTNASEEIDLERVRRDGLRFINLLRMNDVVKGPWELDPMSQNYMRPQWYQLVHTGNGELVRIHPSRMAKFIRNPDPNNFIGTSDLALLEAPINWLEEAERNVSALTMEARIDVMGVEGLMDAVQDPVTERQVIDRYALMAQLKKTNKVIVKDLTREDYAQKQTSFSGLPDVIETFRRGYCAAVEIPYALVYGRQGGLGSNGEVDLQTYYNNIATIQRNEISFPCYNLIEAVIRSALGNRPEEIFVDWLPLQEVSEKERVDNAAKIATAVKTLVDSQAIPADILTEPTVNWLVEINAMPGIEQSYAEWKAGGGTLDDLLGEGEVDLTGRNPNEEQGDADQEE